MGDDTDLELFAGMQSEQPEEQECACEKCSTVVYSDDYTFPYCPQCYVHCN